MRPCILCTLTQLVSKDTLLVYTDGCVRLTHYSFPNRCWDVNSCARVSILVVKFCDSETNFRKDFAPHACKLTREVITMGTNYYMFWACGDVRHSACSFGKMPS